jgi:membrane fusion protein, heavy metal efflux system
MNNILKNRLISLPLFAYLVLSLLSCNSEGSDPVNVEETEVIPEDIVEMRDDQIRLANIETGPVEFRSLNATLKVSGIVTVAPQNRATVCAPLGGFIEKVSLLPGQAVKKGQILTIIENQEFIDIQQLYLEARNRYEYAEAEFNRHSELFKSDVYSEKNMEQVTADYKALKAQVKAFEQKLALIGIDPAGLHEDDISRTVAIVSPINGYIKTVDVNLGKYVTPTDVLFEIVNSDKLLLELTLFEKDADKVATGQKIRFFINNETEQHTAIICQTGKTVGNDKTYKVYADVTAECKNVLPGMYVNALIDAAGAKVASLPSDAIVSFGDKDYIFVFERNKEEGGNPFTEYRMVEIQKGISDDGFTEIILPEDLEITSVRIVIKGAYNLLSAKKNAGEMAC